MNGLESMPPSLFSIVGPIMIGPSSSHTAGAVRLGRLAGALFGEPPSRMEIELYQSFGEVYEGHGTDIALVAGVLGIPQNDSRVKQSFALARARGIAVTVLPRPEEGADWHPNTARFRLFHGARVMSVIGSSTGGGAVRVFRVDDLCVDLDGERALLALYADARLDLRALLEREAGGVRVLRLFRQAPSPAPMLRSVVELAGMPAGLAARLEALPGIGEARAVLPLDVWDTVTGGPLPAVGAL